ncbi:hypothetical protein Tco_1020047 [Tanacetum coccineum]|uniref:Uncharacterized protein n=1 Tax=Tanacetum coccineum TaxID=301880 RepID=A0ABQ5FZ10_9ASTR
MEAIETHSVDPNVSKDNMEPITPKLLNKRTAHSSYIKHTQEEALVLRDIVEHVKANYPQDLLLESAFRYTKVIQDLLSHISRSCPSINNFGPQLVEVTPRKKDKKVRSKTSLLVLADPAFRPIPGMIGTSAKPSDDCMSYDNLCVSNSMNDVKFRAKPKKRNAVPLTVINLLMKCLLGKPIVLKSVNHPKPVVKLFTHGNLGV